MLSTDLFWLSQKSTDWADISEEQKDSPTNGDTMLRLPQQWFQPDLFNIISGIYLLIYYQFPFM